MGNLSEHFNVQEFVPKIIYDRFKEKSRWFINYKTVMIAEFVRNYFDAPVIINDWDSRGNGFQQRGYRIPASTTGTIYSQHKLGNAIDINVKGLSAAEVSKRIIDDFNMFWQRGLTTIEDPADTPTWTHLDCRNTGSSELLIVNP